MKLTAEKVPYSSVVGQSITLLNEAGAVVALLSVQVPNPSFPYRETANEVADRVVAALSAPAPAESKGEKADD